GPHHWAGVRFSVISLHIGSRCQTRLESVSKVRGRFAFGRQCGEAYHQPLVSFQFCPRLCRGSKERLNTRFLVSGEGAECVGGDHVEKFRVLSIHHGHACASLRGFSSNTSHYVHFGTLRFAFGKIQKSFTLLL